MTFTFVLLRVIGDRYAERWVRYQDLQETLSRLPSVEAVRVVESNGHITEVHVLGTPGKLPKQIVRDVQSLAMAAFGVAVDRRSVSVVQLEHDQLVPAERPSIEEIAEVPAGSRVECQVKLLWHNEMFAGSSSGPASQETRARLVGEATLKALEKAVGGDVAFALANIDRISIGPRRVILAVVVMVANGEERNLIGTALVATDPGQAAVRAVLDALNRQIPQLNR